MSVEMKEELECPKCKALYPLHYDGLYCPCGGTLHEKRTLIITTERRLANGKRERPP